MQYVTPAFMEHDHKKDDGVKHEEAPVIDASIFELDLDDPEKIDKEVREQYGLKKKTVGWGPDRAIIYPQEQHKETRLSTFETYMN